MSKPTALIITLILLVITLPFFFITIPVLIYMYNSLIKKNNSVEYAYGSIDVMLKKRFDSIPNAVASVEKLMNHEKNLLENITKIRAGINEHKENPEKRFALEGEMSSLLGQLNLTMENYPEIKSNENMLHLQRTLNELEEQISASRRLYNSSVISFNNTIQSIPTNLVAALLEYKLKVYFKADETEKRNPIVKSLFGA